MTTSTKYLFVGGPMDGYRRDLPRNNYVMSIPVCDPPPVYANAAFAPDHFGVSTHTYSMKRCGAHTIMVHSSIPDSEIMNRLIKGYHGHRNSRRR